MIIFKLPDLGEGLPDAQIREWYIKSGDTVEADQPLVAMETAKALVDVPAPFSGKVEKLYGNPGDTIETGEPLIGFEGQAQEESIEKDAGTVVGAIEESDRILQESATGLNSGTAAGRIKITPALRALAKKLNVDINKIKVNGDRVTASDIERAAQKTTETESMEQLSRVRRAMVVSMTESHQSVVPVSLCDDADIHAWTTGQDLTVRLLRALVKACQAEPMLNASFDGEQIAYHLNKEINVGMAVDTKEGLFVPVLKNIEVLDDSSLRKAINQFKELAQQKSIKAADLHGATIMLSNFGAFAGRYANPILIPPMVAIIGVGRARDEVIAVNGQPVVHRILPLSLTIDHRAVTGGEAARFLRVMLDELQKESV